MIQQLNLSQVAGATSESASPCKGATPPNLVGKTVKEVKHTGVYIPRKGKYEAITIVFTDGTRAMGAGFKAGASPPLTTDGCMVIVSDKGCPFVTF
jgi:hypothetical protein